MRGVRGVRRVSDLRDCLSEGFSVLEWRRGKRPERRFTGLFSGDLADITGGWKAKVTQPETHGGVQSWTTRDPQIKYIIQHQPTALF